MMQIPYVNGSVPPRGWSLQRTPAESPWEAPEGDNVAKKLGGADDNPGMFQYHRKNISIIST